MSEPEPSQEMVEAVAKAIHEARSSIPWEVTNNQDVAYRDARAAIAAYLQAIAQQQEP